MNWTAQLQSAEGLGVIASVVQAAAMVGMFFLYWRLKSSYKEMVDLESRLVQIEEDRRKSDLSIHRVRYEDRGDYATADIELTNRGWTGTDIQEILLRRKGTGQTWPAGEITVNFPEIKSGESFVVESGELVSITTRFPFDGEGPGTGERIELEVWPVLSSPDGVCESVRLLSPASGEDVEWKEPDDPQWGRNESE